MTRQTDTTAMADVVRQLQQRLGGGRVITNPEECAYYSADVYSAGKTCAGIVKVANRDELAATVQLITAAGFAVIARGGGMSYTAAYLPTRADSFIVDMQGLNQIREVNLDAMYVTVEAGVTWQQLYETLAPKGVRTAFFGTLSGTHATVGGALSQGGMFFGSGRHGTALESVLGLEAVLADGRIVSTGQAGHRDSKPFFRWYGPDLTGLFLCDSGSLGFKSAATLRLVRTPKAIEYGSFAFDDMTDCVRAMAEIAREELAVECFGFDPVLQSMRMKRESLGKDIKTFGKVVAGQGSVLKGLKAGASMALAGRGFIGADQWSFHVTCEGRNTAAAKADLDAIRSIAAANHGAEVENTIPKALRAYPFTPLNNMLGPAGERWLPVHGLLNLGDALAVIQEVQSLFAAHEELCARHNIEIGMLIATVSNHVFVFEPVFYWPDSWMPVQRRIPEPGHLARLQEPAPNPAATAAVQELKTALITLLAERGAAHFQIGKTYHYRQNREQQSLLLLDTLKDATDPQHLINPGALGFD